MRTPREILLARHCTAEPRLDAIRQVAVASVRNGPVTVNQVDGLRSTAGALTQNGAAAVASLCLRYLIIPWQELILRSRRVWSGLATVWVLIIVINVSQHDNVSSVTGQAVRSPAVMMSWQAQQYWMNELFAERATPPEADRPRNNAPKPRTGRCGITTV